MPKSLWMLLFSLALIATPPARADKQVCESFLGCAGVLLAVGGLVAVDQLDPRSPEGKAASAIKGAPLALPLEVYLDRNNLREDQQAMARLLRLAAAMGETRAMRKLMDNGAKASDDHSAALMYARGEAEVLILLKNGASAKDFRLHDFLPRVGSEGAAQTLNAIIEARGDVNADTADLQALRATAIEKKDDAVVAVLEKFGITQDN